jgi:hypothetical protein
VRETRLRRAGGRCGRLGPSCTTRASRFVGEQGSAPFTLRTALSPSSRNLLSPAMSSVRDDPAPPSPRDRVENESGSGVGSAGGAVDQDRQRHAMGLPIRRRRQPGLAGRAGTEPAGDMDVDAVASSPKRILADKLFAAALAREPIAPALDLDPTRARRRRHRSRRRLGSCRPRPAKPKLSQVIQRGHMPMDLAYSAMSRDLGSGADELP